LVTISAILIAGCASAVTIPPQPFEDFEQSITTLKTSADEALAVEQQIVFERHLARWVEEADVLQLQLQADPLDPFALTISGKSLYRDIQASRSKLRELNSLLQGYAATLSLLSGSTEDSPSVDADTLVSDLKTNAEAVARSLELEVDIPDGLFFGFGQVAKNLVEGKRQELLIRLINESQAEIEMFARAGQNIAKLSAFGISAEYQTKFSALTAGADDLSESKRKKLIESLLALNEDTVRQIDTLKMVHDAYQALPDAHQDLARAVEEGRSLSFTELLAVAESLKQRYDKFTED
jgi:hypothetical protein